MNKIYAFIIIVPVIAMLMFKAVFMYEYDTKQRYIKDLVDTAAYKVKITGIFSADDYDEM
jgi:glyceraldehyde-3-phosphate dehydrogenase/erythrose-4-phosphate dehydrogenase